jgi:hypothetical protein
MTQVEGTAAGSSTRPSAGWAGWIVFAATILVLIGTLTFIQGLVALFDDGYFVARTQDQLLLLNYDAWGVVMMIWGLLTLAAGLGLAGGRGWARWFAVFITFVHVIVQIGFLPAYPIWAAISIALAVLVLFALTARWHEAQAAMT